MSTELVHLGFSNMAAMNKVVAVIAPYSAPAKRLVHEAKNKGSVIDMTNGRKTKAVIITETGHVLLAAISPETIAGRITLLHKIDPSEQGDERGR